MTTRRTSWALCAVLMASVLWATPAAWSAKRPNIILIMADDMGFSDIGCYGGEIRTPHIDRLARGGVRFTQFYNTSRCCPTRASLMTGLYPHQAGVGHMMGDYGLPGYRGDLSPSCVTIAEVLGAAGYSTYMSGKWHVTRQVGHWSGNERLTSNHNWPRQRGFDRFFGTIHGAGSFWDPISLTRENEPIRPSPGFFYTDAINDTVVGYIDEHARERRDRPFFCYVAHTAPHWPLHALPEDIERYRGRYDAGWDALREERRRRMIDLGIVEERWRMTERDPRVPAWKDAEHKDWEARRMEVYAAQVDRLDQGVGRVIAALERHDLLQDTLILFLADNGGCAEEITAGWGGLHIPTKTLDGRPVERGNDPKVLPGDETTYQSYGVPWANASNTPFRRYKHFVHEGGISSPLVAHWPEGISRAGALERQPAHLIDILATCVDLAGATYPKKRQGVDVTPPEGVSLRPAFSGEPLERQEPLYWEHEGNRAIRQGKWKAVALHDRPWELYDLEADRTETEDLAQREPERLKELIALWSRWAERAQVAPWNSWRR